MKWPASLVALVDYGIIDEVLRPLMSGKEAQVYLVRCGAEERVAKVYKEAEGRSFRQRADYTEGRRTRNSRDQRAVDKRTRHGRAQDEEAWRGTEVDRIRRLRGAGVRVPEPHEFVDGVLVMELVKDAEGHPAPRLGDLSFSATEAGTIYDTLVRETIRMLAADIVHGDLSEFNVLMGADGPVVIDFPQAVDPASNRNARTLLLRDVNNLHRFLSKFAPGRKIRRLGEEMWKLYEEGKLKPDSVLRGTYRTASGPAKTGAVLALIEDAKQDALRERNPARYEDEDEEFEDERSKYADSGTSHTTRQADTPGEGGAARRRVVDFTKDGRSAGARTPRPRSDARNGKRGEGRAQPSNKPEADRAGQPKRRRSRGGRKRTRSRSETNESRSDETRSRGAVAAAPRSQGRPKAKAATASTEPTRGRRRTRRARKPANEGRTASPEQARTSDELRTESGGSRVRHHEQDDSRKSKPEGESSAPRKRSRRRRRRRPAGSGSKPTGE